MNHPPEACWENSEIRCSYCGHQLSTDSHLVLHTGLCKTCRINNVHKCGICNKIFESESDLDRHYDDAISPELIFSSCLPKNKSEKIHNLTMCHNSTEPADSSSSSPTVQIAQTVAAVKSDSVGSIKKHKCQMCPRRFTRKCYLLQHISVIHINPCICNVCQRRFPHKSALQQHYKTHMQKERFICNFCFKSFHFKSQLLTHQLVHSEERPYICETCGKNFKRLQNLNNHYLVHTNERKYKCDRCSASYKAKRDLVVHHKKHLPN